MPQKADARSVYSYTTIRYLVDPERDVTLPVGVLLWNRTENWLLFRLPKEHERIEGVALSTARPYLEVVKSQIESWHRDGDLPHTHEPLEPLSGAWWDRVQRLLRWSVRLGPVRPIDCRNPEEEIHSLYEALVRPRTSARERARRVDGAVGRALGPALSARFQRGCTIPGFRGRPVPVLRCTSDQGHDVVVEAVNLASATAERDADALTSRLWRVKQNDQQRGVRFVLGYVASPGGLNGEAVLKEWVEHTLGTRMYNLDREQESFRGAVSTAIADLDDPLGILQGTQGSEVSSARSAPRQR